MSEAFSLHTLKPHTTTPPLGAEGWLVQRKHELSKSGGMSFAPEAGLDIGDTLVWRRRDGV